MAAAAVNLHKHPALAAAYTLAGPTSAGLAVTQVPSHATAIGAPHNSMPLHNAHSFLMQTNSKYFLPCSRQVAGALSGGVQSDGANAFNQGPPPARQLYIGSQELGFQRSGMQVGDYFISLSTDLQTVHCYLRSSSPPDCPRGSKHCHIFACNRQHVRNNKLCCSVMHPTAVLSYAGCSAGHAVTWVSASPLIHPGSS